MVEDVGPSTRRNFPLSLLPFPPPLAPLPEKFAGEPNLRPAMSRHDFVLPPLPSSSSAVDGRDDVDLPPAHRQPIDMILPVIVLFLFLVAFFSVYLFREALHRLAATWLLDRGGGRAAATIQSPSPEPRRAGLDPAVLESFPVFPYSAVKRLRRKCGLSCAICLSEFADEDDVRLLRICSHAFHPDCIDRWLATHVTCPVCRCDLQKRAEEEIGDEDGSSHRISVDGHDLPGSKRPSDGGSDDDDEYTLRLPEDAGERMEYFRSASRISHRSGS